jgi:dolichyl-phosphate beta-glucosyltransferase
MEKPYLSIVIPAYNEASRKGPGIKEHLQSIKKYFADKSIAYEIVVVNDGSKDDTSQVIASYQNSLPNLVFIDRKENKGKLFSVQEGLLKAQGQFRLFTDADGATPIDSLDKFWEHMRSNEHIIIGSRDLAQSKIQKHQPKIKEILGDLGNYLIQFTLDLRGIKDTQCGFKVLSQEVVEKIIPQMQAIRWGGDFEILALGKRMGYKIIEVPIAWIDSGQSTVGIKGYLQTLVELFQVKWRLMTGKYNLKN